MAAPIDQDIWDSLVELENAGEPGFLGSLLRTFLGAAPARLDSLRGAAASGDAAALESEAHSLKGSCGSIGALRMARVCGRLEQAGQARDNGGLAALLDELETEWRLVREALEARAPAL